MYHGWLDRWDERRARRGEKLKQADVFAIDAGLAFPGSTDISSIGAFCALADQAMADPTFFHAPTEASQGFHRQDEWLKFPSEITTDVVENNVVWAKITEGGPREKALVVFHHWNAKTRNAQIARYFSKRGITVVEISLPYHFERRRPGSTHADFMLSANLGRTIQSVRQAVLDGRKLISWLNRQGYRDISVLGMSLGSWVAAIVASHDLAVSKASLFLTAGSLSDMVWTGRATSSIRASLEPEIGLTDLRRAWCPLNIENYAHGLARSGLDLHIVLAKRDRVVLPELSECFMKALSAAGAMPSILRLNCGHYSLAMPPYILSTALSLNRFLARMGQ